MSTDPSSGAHLGRPDAPAREYYGDKQQSLYARKGRAQSENQDSLARIMGTSDKALRPQYRRLSHDIRPQNEGHRKFLIDVEPTLKNLLSQEDTDNNWQITVNDRGPKVLQLGTVNSDGYSQVDIRGTYMLSNLLQELTLAKQHGKSHIVLDEQRINENPVDRLHRRIRDSFWHNLTRRIDASMLDKICKDPKNRTKDQSPRLYVPVGAPEIYDYYIKAAQAQASLGLKVEYLPSKLTAEWMRDANSKPGLLALGMETITNETGHQEMRGVSFVVPGGRFNEQYGWDSYFEAVGLLVDDKVELAKGMVENFIFEIQHYGKILNANRSYYLMRSQPPFLTDMTLQVYHKIQHEEGSLDFLRRGITASIKEYYTVWMASPRLDKATGLSRYRPEGIGIPPETEATHFLHIVNPYAEKYGMSFDEFNEAYNHGKVHEPDLDTFFLHDRAVRESGHDTTARLEGVCADLATVDLNSLLYKYETDIASVIRGKFDDKLELPDGTVESSGMWDRRARSRKMAMDRYCWNEKENMYFDYNTVTKCQHDYESATTLWALWAGVASPKQANALVEHALPKLEMYGGIVAGTLKSMGNTGLHAPNRQWDFPTGWAPHQIMAWQGLLRYGYEDEAHRLIYRWLFTMTKAFVDYNGIVVEKYNVVTRGDSHVVSAEYGNQGSDFRGVAFEGFGWVNASYQIGLRYCNTRMRRALGTITPPDVFFREVESYTQSLDPIEYATPPEL